MARFQISGSQLLEVFDENTYMHRISIEIHTHIIYNKGKKFQSSFVIIEPLMIDREKLSNIFHDPEKECAFLSSVASFESCCVIHQNQSAAIIRIRYIKLIFSLSYQDNYYESSRSDTILQ